MMPVTRLVRRLARKLPKSRLEEHLRWMFRAQVYKALLLELSQVPVVESGLDGEERVPFVVLKSGVVLFGRQPTEFQSQIYARWCDSMVPAIASYAIGVAIDLIGRYLYPHAMPQITMPYPRRSRRAFGHLQHVETIEDLPKFSRSRKDELKSLFAPRSGESFLDIGSYMGYGTVRLSRVLGPKSRIVAVEADPDNLRLLERNIRGNRLSNVVIVSKAIWNREGVLTFHRGGRQANSLVDSVVGSSDTISVEATTVDRLLRAQGISDINIVSMTINGAEAEAIDGMESTLRTSRRIRLTVAGWYKRNDRRICDIISPVLRQAGLKVAVGREGRVLAWKE